MNHTKYHIIGGSGSGKTYLSNKIGKLLNIPAYDLDDIFWDKKANIYGVKTNEVARDELLNNIISNNDWIVEGIYFQWVSKSFERADRIIILNTPTWLRNIRIICRYIKRKIGIIKSKKETIKDLIELIKWNNHFNNDNMVRIKEYIHQYKGKTAEYQSGSRLIKEIKKLADKRHKKVFKVL